MIFLCSYAKNWKIIKLLLESGANPDTGNYYNTTSLQLLFTEKYTKYNHRVVELLLKHEADPNVGGYQGYTAFSKK